MNVNQPHLALLPNSGHPGVQRSAAAISVVIADDHSGVREGLRQLLDAVDGIEVVAESAELKSTSLLVAERRPDVLVLDLSMPDGSSLQAAGELRRRIPETQIVIVTSDDTPGYAQRALAAGAIGFVLKELADEDLAPAIRAAVQGDEYLSSPIAVRLTAMRQALTDGDLTARESEVLRLIALGHTYVEIARKLDVSARTIETHRANIDRKLGLRTRAELVRYALSCGLLEA
jgi:two-component system response regulator NreC